MADPIRFDWYDYSAYPIPEGTPISKALDQKLKDWANEADTQMMRGDESPVWIAWVGGWVDRGRALAHEVSDELECPVEYRNALTEELEPINFPPPGRVVRRHGRRRS